MKAVLQKDGLLDSEPFYVIVPQLMRESAALLGADVEIPVPDLLDMCGTSDIN